MNRTSDVESNCLVRVENERHVYRLGLAKKTLPSALEHFTIACMGTRSGLPRNRIFLEYQIDVYITGSPESIVKCSNVALSQLHQRISGNCTVDLDRCSGRLKACRSTFRVP